MSGSRTSNRAEDPREQTVFCDMCAEGARKAAVKTCLKCEISMCVDHLQPHLTTPVLRLSHHLTEPMAPGAEGLGATKCPQHGKLIEYYCLDDLTSVCVSCAIEDEHRLHNMKTFAKAHAELSGGALDSLKRTLAAKREESQKLGNWETRNRDELSRSSTRLIETVSKMRDMAFVRVRTSVAARMGSIATGGSSIEAAMGEKDAFRFLQLYSQLKLDVERTDAVDLAPGLESGEERDALVRGLRDAGSEIVAQATNFCGSVLRYVNPDNHQQFAGNAVATFDTLTLGPEMSLSADRRKAFYYQPRGGGSLSGVSCDLEVTGLPPLRTADHSWMIAVSEDCEWTIGLRDKASARPAFGSGNRGLVHALHIQNGQLRYQTPASSLQCIPGDGAERKDIPKTVLVSWNHQTSSLSFFNCSSPHQRLIVSIDVGHGMSTLTPFVDLRSKNKGPAFGMPFNRHAQVNRLQTVSQFPITFELCALLK